MKLSNLMAAIAVGLSILATAAEAQIATSTTAVTASSGTNWGTTATGVTGSSSATDSASMHSQNGSSAGQVNAAKQGILLNAGPGVSITAIGSQNIVSTTIFGDNNSVNVNASQNSSNSGNVSSNGTNVRASGSSQ
jgi:hypothetical protein